MGSGILSSFVVERVHVCKFVQGYFGCIRFSSKQFLDLLLARTENGSLERRWKHVEVVRVFPGIF